LIAAHRVDVVAAATFLAGVEVLCDPEDVHRLVYIEEEI
jgi:hypothetical protein